MRGPSSTSKAPQAEVTMTIGLDRLVACLDRKLTVRDLHVGLVMA